MAYALKRDLVRRGISGFLTSYPGIDAGAGPILQVVRIVRDLRGRTVSPKVCTPGYGGVRTMKCHRPYAKANPVIRNSRPPWAMLAVVVLPALFSSGCIITRPSQWLHNGLKVGPNYGEPPAAVAPQWIQAGDPRVLEVQLPGGAWWDVFQDPIMVDLIHASYAQNPNIRVAGARVLEARAGQAISVGNLFPQQQQMQGNYSRVNLNPNMPVINKLVKTPFGSCVSAGFLQLVLRLQSELGARFMGPDPPKHRVDERQPGCIGRRLRCGTRNPVWRCRHKLRPVQGRSAADQDRA